MLCVDARGSIVVRTLTAPEEPLYDICMNVLQGDSVVVSTAARCFPRIHRTALSQRHHLRVLSRKLLPQWNEMDAPSGSFNGPASSVERGAQSAS